MRMLVLVTLERGECVLFWFRAGAAVDREDCSRLAAARIRIVTDPDRADPRPAMPVIRIRFVCLSHISVAHLALESSAGFDSIPIA